ncbi:MAG: DNA starvation/stationary phase protection protein Dps [Dehalococcoidia bacterium]
MTATMTRPAAIALPAEDLKKARRTEICNQLNANLSSLQDLGLAVKQAHWNVRGPNFYGLHELFDRVAAAVREYADEVAERVVAMGDTAHGTLQDAAKATRLKPFPTNERRWEPLVREVHARMHATAEDLRTAAGETEDDPATEDLYIEVIRGLEKYAWMVEAHLTKAD